MSEDRLGPVVNPLAGAFPSASGGEQPAAFFHRELSWLDYNRRLLVRALDEEVPLDERLHYVAAAASSRDAFARKRLGGLRRRVERNDRARTPDGRTAADELREVRRALARMDAEMADTWSEVEAVLASEGRRVATPEELGPDEREELVRCFRETIYPILTPLAVDPGHPFPFISNQSLSLAVVVRRPSDGRDAFARVKVPEQVGRFVEIGGGSLLVPAEEVIRHQIAMLFRGVEVRSVYLFRVTRDADVRGGEGKSDDLLERIEARIRGRRFAPVVRMEVEPAMPQPLRDFLADELEVGAEEVVEVDGLFDLARVDELAEEAAGVSENRSGVRIEAASLFDRLQERDLLFEHPFDPFGETVGRFVREAASDEQVRAIRQTVYRLADDVPVLESLMEAARRGIEVSVLVDVKNRFDESTNLEWARRLSEAGVEVHLGPPHLKTHAQVTLVLREEEGQLQSYSHIGTGHYHSAFATQRRDLSLLTRSARVGEDLLELFNYLMGRRRPPMGKKLLVAPGSLRTGIEDLVAQTRAYHAETGGGRIVAMTNGLDDVQFIESCYEVSSEGVPVRLMVRGHCRLRPELPGLSETIQVRSAIGPLVEHRRIYAFWTSDRPRLFIGSPDLQRRNFDERVDLLVEVESPHLKQRLVRMLGSAWTRQRGNWELCPSGAWHACGAARSA